MKLHMKKVQVITFALAAMCAIGALAAAIFSATNHEKITMNTIVGVFEENGIDLNEYYQLTEEFDDGWYIVYYPQNPKNVTENVNVYYAVTDGEKKEIKAQGSGVLSLEELNKKIRNPDDNKLGLPESTNIYMSDGRLRCFVTPSVARGNWRIQMYTLDTKTWTKSEHTQVWNTGSLDPEHPEKRILHLLYIDTQKEYIYVRDEDIWRQTNAKKKQKPDELRLDPYTYLPIDSQPQNQPDSSSSSESQANTSAP